MADSALWLFVYGTLKRGHSNHARYCAGYDACVPASVRGALYSLPAGYPMLAVPPETIIVHIVAAKIDPEAAAAAAEPEVIKKGKKEEKPAAKTAAKTAAPAADTKAKKK